MSQRDRRSTELGARLGMLGPIGWFLRPDATRRAINGVSQPTKRGTINTVLWFCGFLGLGWIGQIITGWSGALWLVISFVVMSVIGWNWPFGQDSDSASYCEATTG